MKKNPVKRLCNPFLKTGFIFFFFSGDKENQSQKQGSWKTRKKRPTPRISTEGNKQSTVHIWSSSNHQANQRYLIYSQATQTVPVTRKLSAG